MGFGKVKQTKKFVMISRNMTRRVKNSCTVQPRRLKAVKIIFKRG